MKKLIRTAIRFAILTAPLMLNAKDYSIYDFGAINDGKALSTKAIQSAVNQAYQDGGGRVIIPEGIFLCGTITLKSNVELHLQKNARIQGSIDAADYYKIQDDYALIISRDQHDISITGEGVLDGRGRELALSLDSLHHTGVLIDEGYNYRRMRPGNRPNLVKFNRCKNVRISGIKAMNAADWVLRLNKCEELEIDRIHVDSDVFWNNDGIDLEDCRHVRITNTFINSADDGICLKSNDPNASCDAIYIANNTVRSSASAIKFGTASAGGFKNITIENITIYDTFRSALAFEAVDGGTIDNVRAKNIFAVNTGNAIFIKLGHRNIDGKIGAIRNVNISQLHVHIPFGPPDLKYKMRGPELPFFHNTFPASITGLPGHYVENITLEDINISYPGRADKGYAHMDLWRLDAVPEQEAKYPEFHMFGELPAWGFYVRHVSGLEMRNVRLSIRDDEFRPAYVFDDVKHLEIEDGFVVSLSNNDQVVLKDTEQVNISNLKVDGNKLTKVPGYGANIAVSGVEISEQKEIGK
ncbi:MAG: glycosyl hydrolase family 28 protein [Cytophagales bacterium]|nr:glycosyl hydrolase family 28 protein [Cytophagales bacterium]